MIHSLMVDEVVENSRRPGYEPMTRVEAQDHLDEWLLRPEATEEAREFDEYNWARQNTEALAAMGADLSADGPVFGAAPSTGVPLQSLG